MNKSMCPYPAPEDPKNQPNTRRVPLTQGKFAVVDAEDFHWVMRWKWHAHRHKNHWAAVRKENYKTILMHRVLTFAQPGEMVDHEDGDGLNNRQKNLRRTSHQNNMRGFRHKAAGKTSRFRGVSWHRARKKWRAQITLRPGTQKHLGDFLKEEDASQAYATAARLYFGAFASANILSMDILS